MSVMRIFLVITNFIFILVCAYYFAEATVEGDTETQWVCFLAAVTGAINSYNLKS